MFFDIIPNLEKYPDFKMPSRGTPLSAGLDVYAQEEIQITSTTQLINLGFKAMVPENHAALLMPRSGNGSKFHVQLANTVGLIDHDYQGDWMVAIHLAGKGLKRELLTQEIVPTPAKLDTETDEQYQMRIACLAPATQATLVVPKGEAFCQILIVPVAMCTLRQVNDFETETQRGAGGFGSTDGSIPVEYGDSQPSVNLSVEPGLHERIISALAKLGGVGDGTLRGTVDNLEQLKALTTAAIGDCYVVFGDGGKDKYVLVTLDTGETIWANWNKALLQPKELVDAPELVVAKSQPAISTTPVTTVETLLAKNGGAGLSSVDDTRAIMPRTSPSGGLEINPKPVYSLEELNSIMPRTGGDCYRLVNPTDNSHCLVLWDDIRAEWLFLNTAEGVGVATVARTLESLDTTPQANYHADEPWQARAPLAGVGQSLGPTARAILNRPQGQPLAHVVPTLPGGLPLTALYPDLPDFVNLNNVFVALPTAIDYTYRGVVTGRENLPKSAPYRSLYLVRVEAGMETWVQVGADTTDWKRLDDSGSITPSVSAPVEFVVAVTQIDANMMRIVTTFKEYQVPVNWKWQVGDKVINVHGIPTRIENGNPPRLTESGIIDSVTDNVVKMGNWQVQLYGPELVAGDAIYKDITGVWYTRLQAQARVEAGSLADPLDLLGN